MNLLNQRIAKKVKEECLRKIKEEINKENKIEEKEIKNDINTTKDRLYDAEKKILILEEMKDKKKKKVSMKKKLL